MPSIDLKTAVPGPRSQAVFAERAKHVAPGPFHTTPIVAERAEGATITDDQLAQTVQIIRQRVDGIGKAAQHALDRRTREVSRCHGIAREPEEGSGGIRQVGCALAIEIRQQHQVVGATFRIEGECTEL